MCGLENLTTSKQCALLRFTNSSTRDKRGMCNLNFVETTFHVKPCSLVAQHALSVFRLHVWGGHRSRNSTLAWGAFVLSDWPSRNASRMAHGSSLLLGDILGS